MFLSRPKVKECAFRILRAQHEGVRHAINNWIYFLTLSRVLHRTLHTAALV